MLEERKMSKTENFPNQEERKTQVTRAGKQRDENLERGQPGKLKGQNQQLR